MHMVIATVVPGVQQDDALANGKATLDRIVQDTGFDYYTTFDDHSSDVSGPARWSGWMEEEFGEVITAAPLTSDTGRHLFDNRWQATEDEWMQKFEEVKQAIEDHSAEEILNEDDDAMARHTMYRLGAYGGPSVFLYDEHGAAVRTPDHRDRIFSEAEERANSDDPEQYWIVPADVHF